MSYSTDKAWEQQTAPLMIDALLQVYHGKIEPASKRDDTFHGTDFIWTKPDDKIIRLAMRVRESSFLRYKDDFTIREDRFSGTAVPEIRHSEAAHSECRPKTGHKTELEKIRNKDWAHVYAYGFSDGKRILYWSLFRMSRFNPDAPFQYMPMYGPNDNQDTVTRIYRISGQPEGFLLNSIRPLEHAA